MVKENLNTIESSVKHVDAVVVGLGVLGLMMTKYLTDFGQNVVAIEKQPQIANGPSIKNHGWLHNGVIHAIPGKETSDGTTERRNLVKALQFGREFFTKFAPEALDQPFNPTYAYTHSEDRAALARASWQTYGVPYREIEKVTFLRDVEPGFNPDTANFMFENDDARINNRLLFAKLLADVTRKGATVLRAADYDYIDDYTLAVSRSDAESVRVAAPLFFYATGPNIGESYQKLTGDSLGVEYYKSHLLLLPRVTNESLVTLDAETPIIINHGDVSVVNRARDDIQVESNDTDINPFEIKLAIDALESAVPAARQYRDDIYAIACIKPSIPENGISTGKHSVAGTQIEPIPGHVFAGAGKMTLAPFLGAELVRSHADRLNLDQISSRPMDNFLNARVDSANPSLQDIA